MCFSEKEKDDGYKPGIFPMIILLRAYKFLQIKAENQLLTKQNKHAFELCKPFLSCIFLEPRHEKTCLHGCRPGPTQIALYSHKRRLESGNFGFKKKRDGVIYVAVTAQLICAFVFAYAIARFSHVMANL